MPKIPFRQFIAALRAKSNKTASFEPRQKNLFPPAQLPPITTKRAMKYSGQIKIMMAKDQIGEFAYETIYGDKTKIKKELAHIIIPYAYDELIGAVNKMHTNAHGGIHLQHIKWFTVFPEFRSSNRTYAALAASMKKMEGSKPSLVVFNISPSNDKDHVSAKVLARFYKQAGFDVDTDGYGRWYGFKVFE